MKSLITLMYGSAVLSSIAFAKAGGAGSPTPIPSPAPIAAAASADLSDLVTAIIDNVPLPEKRAGGRGGESLYPFDKLEIGQSFGVKGKTAKGMASTVSSANKRYVDDVKDAAGNVVKDANGKVIRKASRKFISAAVDEPNGVTVRVWRKE